MESMLLIYVKTDRYESHLSGLSENKWKLLSITVKELVI